MLLKHEYLSKKQFVWNLEMGLASLLLRGLDELTLPAILKNEPNKTERQYETENMDRKSEPTDSRPKN